MRTLNPISNLLLAALLGTNLAAKPLAADTLPASERIPEKPKSEVAAYAAAIGGTVAPVILGSLLANWGSNETAVAGFYLIAGGLLIGPSTGQFYAGSTTHGLLSSGIRTIGGLAFVVGAVNSITSMSCLEREPEEPPCENNSGADALAWLGFATYLGGTIYSLAETHFAVQRSRQRISSTYGITPTLALEEEGRLRPGAMAYFKF